METLGPGSAAELDSGRAPALTGLATWLAAGLVPDVSHRDQRPRRPPPA